MAQYFNFRRLIEKYSVDFTAFISSKGEWNDKGEYVEGARSEKSLCGALIGHRESKIFRSEGTITGQDKALYMLEPLENSLQGAEIVHEGKRYSIGELLTNAEFTGVWYYRLKYLSAFNEVNGNG